MRLRNAIGMAMVAGMLATGAVATAAPTAESAGDSFSFSFDDGEAYSPYFSVRVSVNTGGKVNCDDQVAITVRTGTKASTESWSSTPTLCPEDTYRVSVRNDLAQTDSWQIPLRVSVSYPARKGKGGRQPLLLQSSTSRYSGPSDSCSNVGMMGKAVTCDLADSRGHG